MDGYVTLDTRDLGRAVKFYDRLARELGARRSMEDADCVAWGIPGGPASISVVANGDKPGLAAAVALEALAVPVALVALVVPVVPVPVPVVVPVAVAVAVAVVVAVAVAVVARRLAFRHRAKSHRSEPEQFSRF